MRTIGARFQEAMVLDRTFEVVHTLPFALEAEEFLHNQNDRYVVRHTDCIHCTI